MLKILLQQSISTNVLENKLKIYQSKTNATFWGPSITLFLHARHCNTVQRNANQSFPAELYIHRIAWACMYLLQMQMKNTNFGSINLYCIFIFIINRISYSYIWIPYLYMILFIFHYTFTPSWITKTAGFFKWDTRVYMLMYICLRVDFLRIMQNTRTFPFQILYCV